MGDSEFQAVGTLTANRRPLGAYMEVDDVAALLDRFEDIDVKCTGWDGNGHRIWEVRTR